MADAPAMRARPQRSLLRRIGDAIPGLSGLLFLADPKHDCGSAPFDPATHKNAVFDRYFRSARTGLLIYHHTWPAAGGQPKAVVYLVHGYAEHCGRYGRLAAALNAAGITVHALDHAGHGQSEGTRAYTEHLDDYVADVLQLAEHVRPAPAGVPRFILGHSMGGLVALHAAHQGAARGLFTGLVLSGPGLVFDKSVDNPLNRFLARSLSCLLPKLEVQPLDTRMLNTDPAVVAQYERDPLNCHVALRVRLGYEVMNGVAAAREWAPALTLPLLIVHGEADALCNISGSRWLMGAVGCADKRLIAYPGLKHEIFLEPTGPTVCADVADWIRAHADGGAADN